MMAVMPVAGGSAISPTALVVDDDRLHVVVPMAMIMASSSGGRLRRRRGLSEDGVLHAAEVVDAAGDGDGALVAETVLLLRRLQQLQEERVVEVCHRHHHPLPLLAFPPHHDRHATLRRHRVGLLLLVPSGEVRHVERKAQRAPQAVVVMALLLDFVSHLVIGNHQSQPDQEREGIRGLAKARERRATGRSWRWRGGKG
ncbi:hypothetical protein Cni_G16309 [Canna indica]|uniref:Uncharacterized protein n=1 Tax=Canna indica TaxID=4628 RepID=A0AAQ3KHJ3_9LILI|nr:hypothetical protein Cni_G16309 [Canna indica]